MSVERRYEMDFPFSFGGYLDLLEHLLYGWEPIKDYEKVQAMVRAIGEKAVFPAVPVIEHGREYFLTPSIEDEYGLSDGGHHRAVAHHLACEPLHVAVLAGSSVPPYTSYRQVLIADIALVEAPHLGES